jgi:hypothetical protein
LPAVAGKTHKVVVLGQAGSLFAADGADLAPPKTGSKAGAPTAAKGAATALRDGRLSITVPPLGLTAIEIQGLTVKPKFQDRLVGAKPGDAWKVDYLELPFGDTRAMILNFGPAATTAYVYLQADDTQFRQAALTYTIGGRRQTITDTTYPYEFTVPLPAGTRTFDFEVQGVTPDGRTESSSPASLRR